MAEQANENVGYEAIVFDELPVRATREVFLVTLAQAPDDMTKQSFSALLIEAFEENGDAVIEKWVCAKERHRDGGFHFHMAIKIDRQKRWRALKEYIRRSHGINVHFANKQKEPEDRTLYDGAYGYVVKGGDFVVSEGHPDMEGGEEAVREDIKMSNLDFMKLAVQMNLRTILEVQAAAKENATNRQEALMRYLSNKSKARVAEVLGMAWDIEEAPAKLQRLQTDRIALLRECEHLPCTCEEPAMWQRMALQLLQHNGIPVDSYTQAVLAALTLGRGKFRNIMHTGESNRGKTFLLQPLKEIYKAFDNPSRGTFNWVGVDSCEIIVLNDFRWGRDVIPWEQLLLLLEGDNVRFPAPKNKFNEDICLTRDTPVFATSRCDIRFQRSQAGEIEISHESDMMKSRWKTFHFTHLLPEAQQVQCKPCKRCYTAFILCLDFDADAFAADV